ncbi:MAG TPA: YCF48-related protein, partial [Bacteroidota bacterium]|nr:YCF48-related protein [Bacteroidota bacterium]
MKRIFYGFVILVASGLLAFAVHGCDIYTPPNGISFPPVGYDLIMNEMFTISPDKYYAFSWIQVYNPTGRSIPAIATSQPATGYAVGDQGTLLKMSEPNPWSSVSVPTNSALYALGFAYQDTGFAVGASGTILRLTTPVIGGVPTPTWTSVPSGVTNDLTCMTFPTVDGSQIQSSKTGWVGGSDGLVIRTSDRGHTWVTQPTPTAQTINSIVLAYNDFRDLWICADSGIVFKSTQTGSSWLKINPPISGALPDFKYMSFSVEDTGLLVGTGGNVFITNSGSQSNPPPFFLAETSKVGADLYGCDIIKGGNAWAVGDSGVIIHSTDGGRHWKRQHSGTSVRLKSVSFLADGLRGWACGAGGTLLSSEDGGAHWTSIALGTTQNLNCLLFLPLNLQLEDIYIIQLNAVRKFFYNDPATGQVNFNF